MPGARLGQIDAWIQRRSPQEDQAGHEWRETARQVGADPGCAPGHDYNVSRTQNHIGQFPEDRRGYVPLRGEEASITMHHLHRGVTSVQGPAQGNAKVGIRLDFQRAKLDR